MLANCKSHLPPLWRQLSRGWSLDYIQYLISLGTLNKMLNLITIHKQLFSQGICLSVHFACTLPGHGALGRTILLALLMKTNGTQYFGSFIISFNMILKSDFNNVNNANIIHLCNSIRFDED